MITPAYILILFSFFNNGATAAVRVGFTSVDTCIAAAQEVTTNLKATNPGTTVDWSCVKQ